MDKTVRKQVRLVKHYKRLEKILRASLAKWIALDDTGLAPEWLVDDLEALVMKYAVTSQNINLEEDKNDDTRG